MSVQTELRIYICLFALAGINFLAFVAIANSIGGDALNGYSRGGHFFLKNHGFVTEVSETIFTYSKLHIYSVFVTHSSALIASFRYRYLKSRTRA